MASFLLGRPAGRIATHVAVEGELSRGRPLAAQPHPRQAQWLQVAHV
jgi:hypothetical protein